MLADWVLESNLDHLLASSFPRRRESSVANIPRSGQYLGSVPLTRDNQRL